MKAHVLVRALARWLLLPALVLLDPAPASAGWLLNGNPATTSACAGPLRAVAGGSGGVIVVYDEFDPLPNTGVFAQRYNADGNLLWGPSGVEIADAFFTNHLVDDAIPDGNGGVVVGWTDTADGWARVQWLRPDGSARFPAGGLILDDNYTGPQKDAVLHMLGGDRFVFAYLMTFVTQEKVWAQVVDSTATKRWGGGVAVSAGPGEKFDIAITADNAGGVVLAWQDFRNGNWDIYAQNLNFDGLVLWTPDGVPVVTAAMSQLNPQLVPIGANGTMVIWEDRQGASPDIAAARLRENGTVAWGVWVCDAAGVQDTPVATSNGAGGAMIAWEDQRAGNRDIYTTRVTGGGSTSGWPNDGRSVAEAGYDETHVTIAYDGADGAVIAWRGVVEGDVDGEDVVHASRISGSTGDVWLYWSSVCVGEAGYRLNPAAVGGAGDYYVAWWDTRAPSLGRPYAQRIDRTSGLWGMVTPPVITSVTDTPGDGGGFVDVTWQKSSRDDGFLPAITDYQVFRALHPDSLWTQVGTVVASSQPSYTLGNVPTTADNVTHYFRVDAISNQFRWPSQPASGVSIDDPPNQPADVTVKKVGNWFYLQWTPPNPCSPGLPCDVVAYRVYRRPLERPPVARQTVADWEFLGETSETQFTDRNMTPGGPHEWAASAVDASGSEGEMSPPTPLDDTSSDVGDTPSSRFLVAPNVPNPFAQSTTLVFSLPVDGEVRLDVFDVAGRRVLVRALGRFSAGWNRAVFDARGLGSGVYFYRLTAGAEIISRKMVVRR